MYDFTNDENLKLEGKYSNESFKFISTETYNIVSEIEKHASNQSKQAIIYENGVEEPISVTYSELIKTLIK